LTYTANSFQPAKF